MSDWLVIALVVAVAISLGAAIVLNVRGKDREGDTFFWRMMAILAIPGAIALAALVYLAAKKNADGVDIPDEIPPSAPGPDRLGDAEDIERVLTEKANAEAEHIRETATDDEVAATGAAMLDPGADGDG